MLLQMVLFCSFSWLCNIPIVYMYHIFFIHPSVDGHLGHFLISVIVNSAARTWGPCIYSQPIHNDEAAVLGCTILSFGASLVAQRLKSLSVMLETRV